MSIVCEPTCTIPFGFLVVELAIVFCLSPLITISDEEQLESTRVCLTLVHIQAARLVASGSQLVDLVWAVQVRSILNQSQVTCLLHHNEMETCTVKSQCNVGVSGSRASARDHQSIFLSSLMLYYGR